MANSMIWAYLLHLSTHFWDDEGSRARGWYLAPRYKPTNDVDLPTWDNTVRFAAEHGFNTMIVDVGDAVKYETHPEISAPDAWDKDFLRRKLDEMRALGLTPIPKLNFSTCHMTWMKEWRNAVSTPAFYCTCGDLIREVYELFDAPALFHLGMDEETPDPMKRLSLIVIRQGERYWEGFTKLFEVCDAVGTRPWIWSDNYWWGNAEEFVRHIPKDVLQSNWFYHNFEALPKGSMYERNIRTYEEFAKLGYEQVPTGSLCVSTVNYYQTMQHCKKVVAEGLRGYCCTPWVMTEDLCRYDIENEIYRFYCARKQVYPDTL